MAVGKKPRVKKVPQTVVIDCSAPAGDKIMDIATLEKYLLDRIKIEGRTQNYAGVLTVSKTKTCITLQTTKRVFPKCYIKFLVKKYLKKHNLRDWLRISANGKEGYVLKYFNIASPDEEEEEDDDDDDE